MRKFLAIVLCKLGRFAGKLVGKGSRTRDKMSGQTFSASFPGRELPFPTSFPAKRPSLHRKIGRAHV